MRGTGEVRDIERVIRSKRVSERVSEREGQQLIC